MPDTPPIAGPSIPPDDASLLATMSADREALLIAYRMGRAQGQIEAYREWSKSIEARLPRPPQPPEDGR